MKNKKRLVPWLIAAVIIAALAVIGKKLYDLMFGGSLAVTTEDLKNGIIACSPAIIFIVVVLIAALIVVVAAGKLKQPKRALVRAQAPIAILLAITLSVNWVILGVEYSVVNSVFAEDVKVSDETMASGRAIADQIASEGIVLLKETSVAGYIAVIDLTKGGDIIRSQTYEAFLPLIAVALIYLIMVMILSSLVTKLERRLARSDRG